MIKTEHIIEATQYWLHAFIIKLNICPFAKREIEKKTLKIEVAQTQKLKQALHALSQEFLYLDKHTEIETILLVFPFLFGDFFQYLNFIDLAESLIQEEGYEGIYQLATFHPNYCFAETEFDDAANYTNRSPYPMLHILREASLEKAIAYYGDTGNIPTNNRTTLQRLGLEEIKRIIC